MQEDYTVVIFPGTTASPRRIRISRRWFRVGLCSALIFLMGSVGSFTYLSQRYFHLASDEVELTELRRESKIRKIQVEKIAVQIKDFESDMTRLGRFEKKLRVITALEDSPRAASRERHRWPSYRGFQPKWQQRSKMPPTGHDAHAKHCQVP